MKKIILVALVVLALALVGCQQEEEGKENPFLGGTTGLRMSFVQDAPPAEVFDNDNYPFEIAIQVENVGETDVAKEDIEVKIKGLDPEEFGKTGSDFTKSPLEDLMGASKDSAGNKIDGTLTEVTISDVSYEDEIVGASIERPIVAAVCYEYATKATGDLCILEDLLADSSGVCSANEIKEVFSSGAPIQVTALTQRAAGEEKIEFDFTISNLGSVSKIYKEGSECEATRSLENKVKVEVTGLDAVTCLGMDNDGYVTLINNQKSVKCTADIDAETDYEKAITIDLMYAVSDDVTTEILVKHTE